MEALLILIIWLAVIGLILWAVTTYIPMPGPFKAVIYVAGALIALVFLLRFVTAIDLPG